VGVEKLFSAEFSKMKLRWEALQSIFSARVDIFYPPNFDGLMPKGSFSTATGDFTSLRRLFAFLTGQ
jgi:hypothetical protein